MDLPAYANVMSPKERFPLKNSGLLLTALSSARAICVLWANDKWITQEPLPGISPIALANGNGVLSSLRQMATLTSIQSGEPAPDGFPLAVLQALKQAIHHSRDNPVKGVKIFSYGWNQKRCVSLALEFLKADMRAAKSPAAPSVSQKRKRVPDGDRSIDNELDQYRKLSLSECETETGDRAQSRNRTLSSTRPPPLSIQEPPIRPSSDPPSHFSSLFSTQPDCPLKTDWDRKRTQRKNKT